MYAQHSNGSDLLSNTGYFVQLIQEVSNVKNCSDQVAIVVKGVAKVLVGELVETGATEFLCLHILLRKSCLLNEFSAHRVSCGLQRDRLLLHGVLVGLFAHDMLRKLIAFSRRTAVCRRNGRGASSIGRTGHQLVIVRLLHRITQQKQKQTNKLGRLSVCCDGAVSCNEIKCNSGQNDPLLHIVTRHYRLFFFLGRSSPSS